jgi:hypothetical protein
LTPSKGIFNQQNDIDLPLSNKALDEAIQWLPIDIPEKERCHPSSVSALRFLLHPDPSIGRG